MKPRGYFGIGVVHSKTAHNIGTLLRSANVMGAAFVFTVGRRYGTQASDTMRTDRHLPLYHYDSIDDLVAHLPLGCQLIGIELDDRSVPLHHARHPMQACYLLGAEDSGLSNDDRAKCHRLIEIQGPTRCLNVAVAGSIVMYDRLRALHREAVLESVGGGEP